MAGGIASETLTQGVLNWKNTVPHRGGGGVVRDEYMGVSGMRGRGEIPRVQLVKVSLFPSCKITQQPRIN